MENTEVDVPQSVIDAFHLMWDNFPEAVRLIHKSKWVIAANKAADKMGVCTGVFCNKQGCPEMHRGCLAGQCVKTGEFQYVCSPIADREFVGFWQPVAGYPDLYIHGNIGLSINYKTGEKISNALEVLAKSIMKTLAAKE